MTDLQKMAYELKQVAYEYVTNYYKDKDIDTLSLYNLLIGVKEQNSVKGIDMRCFHDLNINFINKVLERSSFLQVDSKEHFDSLDLLNYCSYLYNGKIFNNLLKDRTSKKNIMFMTDNYSTLNIKEKTKLELSHIINEDMTMNGMIKPRHLKSKDEQTKRSKDKAEVFTPSWICNKQNNLVDLAYFKCKVNKFNTEDGKEWIPVTSSIKFPKNKTWEDYVSLLRMEVTCGEAPYLVSRYDTTTGNSIPVNERIGLLDRKLRVINENVDKEKDWLDWVYKAYKSIYGFDYQGDNLFLSRINLLNTFIDNYIYKFNEFPNVKLCNKIAEIISWNIFQMDGLLFTIPQSTKEVVIKDWDTNTEIKFKDLLRGEK